MSRSLALSCSVGFLSVAVIYFAQVSVPLLFSIQGNTDISQAVTSTWFHPQRAVTVPPKSQTQEWDLFYHLGGYGPWIQKVDGVLEGGVGPPKSCRVEQVHMVLQLEQSLRHVMLMGCRCHDMPNDSLLNPQVIVG
jgi:hypothetical protein